MGGGVKWRNSYFCISSFLVPNYMFPYLSTVVSRLSCRLSIASEMGTDRAPFIYSIRHSMTGFPTTEGGQVSFFPFVILHLLGILDYLSTCSPMSTYCVSMGNTRVRLAGCAGPTRSSHFHCAIFFF